MAAGFAALLVLVALAQARTVGRLARDKADAAVARPAWWLATPPAPPRPLPAGAAGQWERLNRARIAAAYALGRRGAILQDVAGLLRAAAQVALIAVGAWLVIDPGADAGGALRLRAHQRRAC